MKKAIIFFILILALTGCRNLDSESWQEREEFAPYFESEGVTGTFILFDLNAESYHVYNPQRARTGFIPASTYKIFNSLVALETGQIEDEREIIPWDGVDRGLSVWNRDHNLQTAIQNSVVWFYQDLARGIGSEQMAHYLEAADYGNAEMGAEIDTFWLEGDLRITPQQQVDFLHRLYQDDLPFSQTSMDVVKDILIYETGDDYIMRAKTGWGQRFDPQVGWFVGYVEQDDNVYFFATNIDIVEPGDPEKRISITKNILKELGLL